VSWCAENNGRVEVRLADGSRYDCTTATHAIEFDFGPKWSQGLGQALNYSYQTGKRAGIVLIVEREKGRNYFKSLESVIKHFDLPIDIWLISW